MGVTLPAIFLGEFMNERHEQLRLDPTRDLIGPRFGPASIPAEDIWKDDLKINEQLEMDVGIIKGEKFNGIVKNNPLNIQTGGNHYKDMKIQPIVYSMENNLNACQHSVVKYISRYKSKNGLEDLKKARHFIDLLMKIEYDYSE